MWVNINGNIYCKCISKWKQFKIIYFITSHSKRVCTHGLMSVRWVHIYGKFIFYKSRYVDVENCLHILYMPIVCVCNVYKWDPRCCLFALHQSIIVWHRSTARAIQKHWSRYHTTNNFFFIIYTEYNFCCAEKCSKLYFLIIFYIIFIIEDLLNR